MLLKNVLLFVAFFPQKIVTLPEVFLYVTYEGRNFYV